LPTAGLDSETGTYRGSVDVAPMKDGSLLISGRLMRRDLPRQQLRPFETRSKAMADHKD
jgi:hypothetical protein